MRIILTISDSFEKPGEYYFHVFGYAGYNVKINPFVTIVPNLETNLEPIQEFINLNTHLNFINSEIQIIHKYQNAIKTFI